MADSNGQYLDPNLLHEDHNVTIETRFTIEEAVKNIPRSDAAVTDVVFLVGVNNIKKPNASIPDMHA